MEKAYITRFVLDHLKPEKLQSVKELCNDRRPWVCSRLIAYTSALILSLMYIVVRSIHIGVGSGLLVLTDWAISGPQVVERVTDKSPRFFLYLGGSRKKSNAEHYLET